jgi:hypothetical protein
MKNKRKSQTSDPLSKIWWHNLEFDVSQENVAPAVYKDFLSVIQQFLKAKRKKARPVETIIEALGEPPVRFSLMGRPAPATEPLSRVVDALSFSLYNIDKRLGLGSNPEETVWNMFRNGDIVPKRHFVGELRSARNLFWGTPTSSLEPLCDKQEVRPNEYVVHPPEKADEVATEIRNLLGLSYLNEGVGLYRIDIPKEKLKDVKICAPTTLDSSPRCVFLPAEKTKHYGLTLNLTNLGPGAEEVVVEPIKFTEEFTVTQIGYVKGPLPNEQAVWSALANIVKDRRARREAN